MKSKQACGGFNTARGFIYGEQKKDSAFYCGRGFSGVRYRISVSLCNVFTTAGSDSGSLLGHSAITERNQDNGRRNPKKLGKGVS